MLRRIVFVALLMLASCGVESVQPLTPLADAKFDATLLGTWSGTDGDAKGMDFVITQVTGKPLVHIVSAGEKEELVFEGHVSVVNKDLRVLNLRALEHGKPRGNYLFVRYALRADDQLEVSLLDDKLVSEAVRAGTLKGKPSTYSGYTLDETPAKLIAYVTGSKQVFKPLALLKKS